MKQIKKLIQEQHQKKVNECGKEIQAVLEKYGFQLDVTKPQVVLIPKE